MEKGYIQVYTGPGKGKTTAALGQALRAVGHDMEVCIVYFYKMPEKWDYKGFSLLENLGVEIHGFAKKHPDFFESIGGGKARKETLRGLEMIEKIFDEKSFDMIILDEVIIAVRDGYIEEKELLGLLDKKPEETELVLTGRGATESLKQRADLVSDIRETKHHFNKGVERRKGIEY
ncbi:hypothetical protein AKJ41_00180 [candidate division MSBL1 archaeon SCGC-AAA259O05]|uniref:Cobinamide adenolsyltransferase n=1 Tax=candidate division MSBL1 archaeon SCGC-AAA259O05 TaxID=1698271 RepID=A0A133V5U8_9EURY|nr:hypothetical protein AKJ41_00180 [candidate division MSBL1 archaeon SCGC-AAA259O05]